MAGLHTACCKYPM